MSETPEPTEPAETAAPAPDAPDAPARLDAPFPQWLMHLSIEGHQVLVRLPAGTRIVGRFCDDEPGRVRDLTEMAPRLAFVGLEVARRNAEAAEPAPAEAVDAVELAYAGSTDGVVIIYVHLHTGDVLEAGPQVLLELAAAGIVEEVTTAVAASHATEIPDDPAALDAP